jgi:threonine synthase
MKNFICLKCSKEYGLNEPRWKCDCGNVLDIEYKYTFDISKLKNRKNNLWRYRESLPIEDDNNIISFGEGFTPLVETYYAEKKVLIKFEHLFPTGSFKDRGATVLISKIKELKIKNIVEDSSGNAGAAIAAYSAKAGIHCHIYVPEKTSKNKLVQIEMFGATLHKIPGTREDTSNAAIEASLRSFYASHSWNPFFFQGTKTFAFEIWEQLNFKAPDIIIIPTGNGTLLIGTYLGFKDLLNQKLIDKLPRLVAVQSDKCAPLYKMLLENLKDFPNLSTQETISEGIAIARPIRAKQIIEIIKESNGMIITATDEEIKNSLKDVCKMGIYLEPTSAIAFAGAKKIEFSEKDIVIIPVTGHGLKYNYQ